MLGKLHGRELTWIAAINDYGWACWEEMKAECKKGERYPDKQSWEQRQAEI